MLISKEVEVTLSPNTIKYYENKGYEINRVKNKWRKWVVPEGTKLKVNVFDLPDNSTTPVQVLCDYCLENGVETIIEKPWRSYVRDNIDGVIHTDCCVHCKGKKIEESNMAIYNVKHVSQTDGVKAKMSVYFDNIKFQTYSQIYDEFKKRDYTLLTTINDFQNEYTILNYICNKHPNEIQTTFWNSCRHGNYNCKFCLSEHRSEISTKYTLEDAKQIFLSCGFILMAKEFRTVKVKMPFICLKHPDEIQYSTLDYILRYGQSCKFCRYEKTRGENNCNWKGGVSQLNDFLRTCITDWKKSTLKNCGYKCVLTNKKSDLIVHHLYGFDLIVKELMDIVQISMKQLVNEYSEIELQIIKDVLIQLHNKYGYGVVLSTYVHKLFHSIYGFGNNTPEQFKEFKQKYKNGEFNEILNKIA
jgi:hypothetical protein